VLPAAIANKKRHETLQRFMLVNDSATIAVEIPVYLTKENISYYRGQGFDFLQGRDGYNVQLTIYALALARRSNLPLKYFKCAWFDDKDNFEFFSLQGVYALKPRVHGVGRAAFTAPGAVSFASVPSCVSKKREEVNCVPLSVVSVKFSPRLPLGSRSSTACSTAASASSVRQRFERFHPTIHRHRPTVMEGSISLGHFCVALGPFL